MIIVVFVAAPLAPVKVHRGGSRNSLKGGSGPEFFEGGGGVRVQVRGNFHILTSQKKKKTSEGGGGGLNPLTPPPPWIRYWYRCVMRV